MACTRTAGECALVRLLYDYTYIRSAKDFVTRTWREFPVKTRADWEEKIKWRYDPRDPERFPSDFEVRCAALRERDYVMTGWL